MMVVVMVVMVRAAAAAAAAAARDARILAGALDAPHAARRCSVHELAARPVRSRLAFVAKLWSSDRYSQ